MSTNSGTSPGPAALSETHREVSLEMQCFEEFRPKPSVCAHYAQTGSWNAPETMVEEHSSGTAYTNQPQARCEWVADTDTHVVDFANY